MRPLDDKECYSYGTNGVRPHRKTHQHASRAKPTPSKWDDAQKWLVGGMSTGRSADGGVHAKHRNSNADDWRLLSSSSQNGRVSCSSVDGALEYSMVAPPPPPDDSNDAGETKKMDCMMQGSPAAVIRSVCLRDMGTEMTPIASKEPSRTATPLRASTPVARSPISSRSSTPVRRRPEGSVAIADATEPVANMSCRSDEGGAAAVSRAPDANTLESRAAAWDEAERAKFTARCECLSRWLCSNTLFVLYREF